jgi:Xaa-Pro aminopeptidase
MTLLNRERAEQVLAARGVDLLVATRPENLRYLTDVPLDLAAALELPVAALLLRDGLELAALVAPRGMSGLIGPDLVAATKVHLYGHFHAQWDPAARLRPDEEAARSLLGSAPGAGQPFPAVLAAILHSTAGDLRVAWDAPGITSIAADAGLAPSADGEAVLREIRQVKTPAEVDRLRRAAAVAEAVEVELMTEARAGVDWADLARSVPGRVTARGGSPGFFSGGAGWQGGFLFEPRPMPLRRGDLVRLDLGLSADGYWSDTGRSASIGEPSAKALRTFEAIRDSVEAALATIRPGTTFEALYEAAMAVAAPALPGFRRHHTGHAIGLRAYDGPLVAAGDATRLEPGMVVNIEVPYYEIGWGGLQVEETVVVEPDGWSPITRLSRDLVVSPD